MRARYEALMAQPEAIETTLQAGAAKARALAAPLLATLREAVGLRRFQPLKAASVETHKHKSALPSFKQYREPDNLFYFKLVAADGELLLQSQGLAQGRDAGQWVARLKKDGAAALADAPVTVVANADHVRAALAALQNAEA